MRKIGRYEIIGELGRGAMGVVYRALDPNIGRTVALKTMRLDVEDTERDEMLFRFRSEARAAGLMNHQNIVTIHDADEYDGLFYLAMEYLEGDTLQSLMAGKRAVGTDQIVDIGKQIATGLEYAHSMKVVHRDIKPANLMITRRNIAKIMDFGISKSIGTKTRTGQVLGTPNYMSPEQVVGRPLDGRSDLFSLGVVLYEMATGEPPFAGDNVTTIIYKIVHEDPVPACQLQMAVHPGLSAVIMRCLVKRPDDRYQSGAQLVRDLENFRNLYQGEDQLTTALLLESQQNSSPQIGFEQTPVDNQPTFGTTRGPEPSIVVGDIISKGKPSGNRNLVISGSAAIFLLLSLTALHNAHQGKQASLAQHYGEASVVVDIPKPTTRHELAEKPLVQPTGTPITSASSRPQSILPNKVQLHPLQRTVAIHFTSTPEGALIRLDGRSNPEWVTPYTIPDIVPGSHQVMFLREGYSSEIRQLEIGPKDAVYGVELVPQTTALLVSSDPAGASVEIDGTETGKFTPAQIPLIEGWHSVVLQLEGYRPARTAVQVAKGQISNLPQHLIPLPSSTSVDTRALAVQREKAVPLVMPDGEGLVDFVTVPAGADIFIEGQRANRTTPAHNFVPPGDYSVELRMSGFKTVRKNIHVDAGATAKVQEILEHQ